MKLPWEVHTHRKEHGRALWLPENDGICFILVTPVPGTTDKKPQRRRLDSTLLLLSSVPRCEYNQVLSPSKTAVEVRRVQRLNRLLRYD